FSLLEALTIAPMRCSQFLEVGHSGVIGRTMDSLMRRTTELYRRILQRCLDNRWAVVGLATLFFVASLGITKALKKEFVPSQDQSRFLVRMTLPLGTSLEVSDGVFKKAEAWLMSRPEVFQYYSAVGGFGGGQVNQGILFVTMHDPDQRPLVHGHHETQAEFMQVARKGLNSIPGVQRAVIQDLSQAGFTASRGFPVEFTVQGPDWDKLAEVAGTIMDRMKASGKMVDVDTDYQLGMPELQVHPDRVKAAQRGVSIASIADTINAMIGGVRVGKFTSAGKRYDIRVRLAEADRSSPKDIDSIWVRNEHGEVVPLRQVVTAEVKPTLLTITRHNRERAITIFANPAPGTSQEEALGEVQNIGKQVLPDEYHIVMSGGSQAFKESFQSLIFALVLGIFVAYMVLASQFNSFIHPFTVLLALPFSVTGAFGALWLWHQSLNLYSMIGLILLMGIVKKNSILLVDFTNERRKKGAGVRDALMEACPLRLRPIIMTSVSTVAAAVPEALAKGAGAETMVPMAVVLIGGVLVSTLLTLLVVPCAYSLLSGLESHAHDRDLHQALVELGELPASPEPRSDAEAVEA
ncbi:MAG: efflux RND transporter permease subunit, partial [Elusimicrobia bacterium]|nr:efflux RND transporter permease subunit [Elusimicrobiota bacterium]